MLLLVLQTGMAFQALGQTSVELTFRAVDSTTYVRLDSIKVINRSQGGDTMLYWPDTTLSLEIGQGTLLLYVGYATFSSVGIPEMDDAGSSFKLYQNHPNPMAGQSEVSVYIPHRGRVQVMITDLQGKVVLQTDRQLEGGHHAFSFCPGGRGVYFLTVHWNGFSRSIKMVSTGQKQDPSCQLEYLGGHTGEVVLKASSEASGFVVRESGILDSPEGDTTYTFQFASGIPCLGTPAVIYEGQVYNAIQIFSQCWLKENLNVGVMINGSTQQSDNGTIEKFCYNNVPDSCIKYGGLYQWWEMMQYTFEPGTQGICPPGWHLPTDEEWKVLEGAVDSQYGIGDGVWENLYSRGYDAGTNLKAASGWYANGNGTDQFGFSGLPGGSRYTNMTGFDELGVHGYWWGSDAVRAWGRILDFSLTGVGRGWWAQEVAFSVRCVKD